MQTKMTIAAGDYIFREGDAGSEMYLIESGAIEILRQHRGPEPIAVLQSGDFFGEMAVLEDQPRFASARAKTETSLLRVEREDFGKLLITDVEIAIRIMRKLAQRLRRSEQQLALSVRDLAQVRKRLVNQRVSQTISTDKRAKARSTPQPLLVLEHDETGTRFLITDAQGEWLVGRPDPVTGMVPELNFEVIDSARTLSRRHAKVLVEGNLVFLREEVGVANGTQINGTRLKAGVAAPLNSGDRLIFGNIALNVLMPSRN